VTERSVIVTTEKPGLDEPANTFAVDRRNGEVRWQREQPGNIGYDAVAAGGRLYVPVLWDFHPRQRERRDTSGTGQLEPGLATASPSASHTSFVWIETSGEMVSPTRSRDGRAIVRFAAFDSNEGKQRARERSQCWKEYNMWKVQV